MSSLKNFTISKVQCHWKIGPKKRKCQRVEVWARCYERTIKHAKSLAKIIKKDFPGAKNDEIAIVIYGGQTKKGMMGAAYDPGRKKIPKDYAVHDSLDVSN
jgi:hypothetical protein